MKSYQRIYEKLNGRKNIWICGLDIISIGLIRYLEERGISVDGILDDRFRDTMVTAGIRILPINHIYQLEPTTFFVITAFHKKMQRKYQKILEECFGTDQYLILSNPTEIRIDISGKCNLRCPSCQVANHCREDFNYHDRGFMKQDLFEKILDKLEKEIPEIPAIYLFTLGEPLLHPEVSKFVKIVHEKGYLTVLSSNLSMRADLETIVDSEPDVLKISVSGFTQNVYGKTHVNGDIELVKENMKQLWELIRRKKKNICVLVGYHIYNNNSDCELSAMEKLCSEYGFIFQPVRAMYFNMLKRTGYEPFLPEEVDFINTYYEKPEEILMTPDTLSDRTVGNVSDRRCRNMSDKLFIDYDGNVMLCELFHRDGVFKSYLDTTVDEIQHWRKNHWICERCQRYGMHLKAI